MAKTFNDFMIECAAYPYSQQCFDMMKECSELELTAQFLESQQYVTENHDTLFGESVELQTGYMTESADEQTITVMTEKFEEKAGAVWNKIVKGVQNLIKTLRNLFLRITAKFDENTKIAQALVEKFNSSGGLDEQSARHMVTVLEKHKPSKGFKVPENKSQPFASKIKFSGFPDSTKNLLAVALSPTSVVLGTPNAKADQTAALDIRDIRSVVNAFKGTVKNEASLKGCQATLTGAINKSINDGLTLPCSNGYLKRCADDLEKIQKAFENEGRVVTTVIADKADAARKNDGDGEQSTGAKAGADSFKLASSIYSSLTTCIGATTSMYLELHNYRTAVVKELSSLVPDAGSKKKKNENDEK